MKSILFIFLFLPFFLNGQALISTTALATTDQSIHGFVFDKNGVPLPGANIIAKKGELFHKGTTSNEEGFFELKTGVNTIEISFLGYETLTTTWELLKKDPLVVLQENIFELDAVVVMAYQVPMIDICCWTTGNCYQKQSSKHQERSISPQVNSYEFNLKPYPNPTIDLLYIPTPEQEGTLQLFSSNGRLLQEQRVTNVLSHFNLMEYAAGTYILRYKKKGNPALVAQVIKAKT